MSACAGTADRKDKLAMQPLQLNTAIMIGILFACGTYLVQQNSLVKVLFGFSLLGHGANLTIIAMAGSPLGKASPIVGPAGAVVVDPLPQALILTAIVIGFAVTAYLTVLLYRLFLDYRNTRLHSYYEQEREQEQHDRWLT